MADSQRPFALLLGAPIPPPFGGIAHYLRVALPELARDGWEVVAVQPPGSALKPELEAATGGAVRTATAAMTTKRRGAAYLLRHPWLALKLAWWYVPAVARGRATAVAQLEAVFAWLLAAEAAAGAKRPTIVHAYDYPWIQGVAAVLLARRWRARAVISTFGEVVPHRDELQQVDDLSKMFRRVSRAALREADVVASMTDHCRRQTANAGFDPACVRLVRLVVGMDRFRPDADCAAIRARHGVGDGPLLLFVGQVRPRKGPQTLVQAMPEILGAYPGARLLVVGPDHRYAHELEQLSAELGVADAVELTGPANDEDLPAYFAAADVFLFPTLTPIECLGLTFVQAMFSATPVVATRIAGAPSVINHGEDGFLVHPGDPAAFAAAVRGVLDLPLQERAEIGGRARRRALELFDESLALEDVRRLYRELAGAHAPPPVDAAA